MATRQEREEIAKKRLQSVLGSHGIATSRTLEQKISDAGPYNQRIHPHILTGVRNDLVNDGVLRRTLHANVPWFSLTNSPAEFVQERLAAQIPTYQAFTQHDLTLRLGQVLEIATYKALREANLEFFGRYRDLDAHDDSTAYSKEEPPQHIGAHSLDGNKRLDFILRDPHAGYLGLECKNVREWLYPDRSEITDAIQKCIQLDCVPVLIGRRIPYVTFRVLSRCGVICHENYNQLVPQADAELAERARHKLLLGYHDVRTGNVPDERLKRFLGHKLPEIAPKARDRFEEYKDLLSDFAFGQFGYTEFAARVRRRFNGQNEDHDWEDDRPEDDV